MEINMDTTSIASRRSVLKGLSTLAAFATASAPVMAAESAKPVFVRIGSPIPLAGAVTATIAQHKAIMRHIERLLDEVEKLETLPGRPKSPSVPVGYSHESISKHCEAMAGSVFLSEQQRAAIRAKYRGYHLDLTRQIRALAKFDRTSGLTSLMADVRQAYHREAAAEAALLLAMPVTAKEAATKASYIKQTEILHEWTESRLTYPAVMSGLCAVGGRA
jgi:hypothetical protein